MFIAVIGLARSRDAFGTPGLFFLAFTPVCFTLFEAESSYPLENNKPVFVFMTTKIAARMGNLILMIVGGLALFLFVFN